MNDIKLGKAVRRVLVIDSAPDGSSHITTVYKTKNKKTKKRRLKRAEKLLRRLAMAERAASGIYLKRHRRSGTKHKDGALRDFGRNLGKAMRKGAKKAKLKKGA